MDWTTPSVWFFLSPGKPVSTPWSTWKITDGKLDGRFIPGVCGLSLYHGNTAFVTVFAIRTTARTNMEPEDSRAS